jgi:membrane associated rhomboid family serine protease
MVTYFIIALNCIFSFKGFNDRNFFNKFLYNPYRVNMDRKEQYTILTHAFLHADIPHLLFNMFAFYSFGLMLEQQIFPQYFGKYAEFLYILLYFGGIVVSAIPAYIKQKNNPAYNAVGASGAVSAVIFSSILILPNSSVGIMFIPFPIPATLFGILYIAITWYLAKRGGGRIAHDAHLWGSLFGFVFTFALRPAFLPDFIDQLIYTIHHLNSVFSNE